MVTCPSFRDPFAPQEIALAVPNAGMSEWILWIPLTRAYALLQDFIENDSLNIKDASPKPIMDRRIPRFRLPNQDREADDKG